MKQADITISLKIDSEIVNKKSGMKIKNCIPSDSLAISLSVINWCV